MTAYRLCIPGLLAVAVSLSVVFPARAQQSELTFGRVTLPGGAYGNYVTSIVQDNRGFMWFGTWGGLHRYDGYELRSFVNDPDNPASLSATWVESLYVDREGTLWVGTFGGGLNRFDPRSETFARYLHDEGDPQSLSENIVTVMLEDHEGNFWIGTHGGLNLMDRTRATFTHYRNDPSDAGSLSDDQVRALYEDRSGTLWVGTGSPSDPPYGRSGLNRFDRETDTFTSYVSKPGDASSLIDSQVRSILEDTSGRFWVGTWGDGLHTMDRESGTFVRHTYDPAHPEKLGRPHLRDDPGRGGVSFIYEDRSGIIWIGAVNGGLNRYDPVTGALDHYEGDADEPNSLGENRVWTIYESRDGTLWVGTLGGLHRVDTSVGQFYHYSPGPTDFDNATRAVVEGPDGVLWLGTSSGVHMMVRSATDPLRYRYRGQIPAELGDVRIHSLLVGRSGELWIGTWEQGLYRYDRSSGRLEHVRDSPQFENVTGASIMALSQDRDGAIWIGTATQGLGRLDPSTGSLILFRHDPNDPASLGQNSIRCIIQDGQGVLWVGSDGGLSVFDGRAFKTFTFKPDDPSSIADNVVTGITEDADGRLWIGTEIGGLNLFDRDSESFTRLTTEGGLPADGVLSLIGDRSGYLWISSERGLTRFDPEKRAFNSFGADFGLPAEPFYAGSVAKGQAGTLLFGGRNGFHVFMPEEIRPLSSPTPPELVLTGLSIFGQPVSPGPESPIVASITELDTLNLTYAQNDLRLSFAALHFHRPAGNQYSYVLEPYQSSWSTPGLAREASFTNLDPGEYVFRVRAASSDGVWNEEGRSLSILIRPPYWATWWFRSGLLILVVALAGAIYHGRVRQIQAQNRRLEREVTQRTHELENSLQLLTQAQDQLVHADKMASLGQLAAGIAHEIKNPLNFVNNFAELSVELVDELDHLLEKKHQPSTGDGSGAVGAIIEDLRSNVRRINEHGARADGIVRSMLDHSRGQTGERVLADLNALLEQYVNLAYHGMRARHAGFNATFHRAYDDGVGMVKVVPQEIGRVFVNLLNNALDALQTRKLAESDFDPMVYLSTAKHGRFVEIRIGDNGPGVPDAIRYKVFEPFFTTKPMGTGTGLGLSLSYEIVTQGHGGSLTLEGNEHGGATFVITLPA